MDEKAKKKFTMRDRNYIRFLYHLGAETLGITDIEEMTDFVMAMLKYRPIYSSQLEDE